MIARQSKTVKVSCLVCAIGFLSLQNPAFSQKLEDLSGWGSLQDPNLANISFEDNASEASINSPNTVEKNNNVANTRSGYSFIAKASSSPGTYIAQNDTSQELRTTLGTTDRAPSNQTQLAQIRERTIIQEPRTQSRSSTVYPTIDDNVNRVQSQSVTPQSQPQTISRPQINNNEQVLNVAHYSLNDILRQTISFHPNVARTLASYQRALAQTSVVRSQWQPQVSLFATHNFKNELGLPLNESNPSNETKNNYGLRAVQSLNYRGIVLDLKASKSNAEASKERYFDAQDQIALEAALSYVQIFRFYNRYEIGLDYVNLLTRISQKVSARSGSGLTNALEDKKVAVIETRISAENEFNRRQFETAQLFLSNITGITNLNVRALKDFNFRIPSLTLQEQQIIDRALETNRSLLAAKRDVERAENNWKKEKSTRYPEFDLDADITWQDYTDRARNGTFQDGSVRINMNYDLWTGRAKSNRIKSSRWELEESVNQYKNLELQITNEIQSAYTGFNVALSEYKHAEEARKKSIELLRLQEQDFSRGTSTSLLDLINTTQEWFTSATQSIDAYYEMMSRYLQIKRFIGEILDNNI